MTSDQSTWPSEFADRIRRQFPETANHFLGSLDQGAAVSIRLNPAKFSPALLPEKVPWCGEGYFLRERPVFALDPLWHAGAYYVQEASSMFLEQVFRQIDIVHPKLVLDLCAAPGGKSTHLNSLIAGNDLLVANEVIRSRVPVLTENLVKWGKPNFLVSNSDAKQFGQMGALFDVLVVDAPCSGEGLFRRDSEAAKEWSVENSGLCAARQRRILAECWPGLKKGGYLVYSTCTFNPAENEENLSWLSSRCGFSSIRVPVDPAWQVDEFLYGDIWGYRFLPHRMKSEGFFISLLRKEEDTRDIRFPKKFRTRLQHSVTVPEWTRDTADKKFFQHQDQIKFIPAEWEKEILYLFEQINLVHSGTVAGNLMKKEIIPDHELAMSVSLLPGIFDAKELDLEGALKYLGRNQPEISAGGSGWQLVTFKQVPLGFVKNVGRRYNNYYPVEWRLRMQPYPSSVALWYENRTLFNTE